MNGIDYILFGDWHISATPSMMYVELAWRSSSVMDCHTTARGSIPGGNGVFTELHVLRMGQKM